MNSHKFYNNKFKPNTEITRALVLSVPTYKLVIVQMVYRPNLNFLAFTGKLCYSNIMYR